MRSYDHKHPKGNKYSENELKRHRDNWYAKITGNTGLAGRQEVVETDKHVYSRLIHLLPWDGSIRVISDNNFDGSSFRYEKLRDFDSFEYQCRNPAFEFIDPDLESLRAKLYTIIHCLSATLAENAFPTTMPGDFSVPAEWEVLQPMRFHEVVSKIHETCREIVETYSSLVRTATRKLGILPETMLTTSDI
jgi:hypothetical protein